MGRPGAVLALLTLWMGISFPVELYFSPKFMVWEEFYGGSKLLREEGLLGGLGVRWERKNFTAGGEFYGGTLAYDGQTQAGDPVKTRVNYSGLYLYIGPYFYLSKFLDLEFFYRVEAWRRDIESTPQALGYAENWLYYSLDAKLTLWFSDLHLYYLHRFVLGASMQASLIGFPPLEPKRDTAFEVGGGIGRGKLSLRFFYSYLKFAQSDPKQVGSFYVLQPTSVRQLYGVSLGIKF